MHVSTPLSDDLRGHIKDKDKNKLWKQISFCKEKNVKNQLENAAKNYDEAQLYLCSIAKIIKQCYEDYSNKDELSKTISKFFYS